jgi:hypothetical protein
VGFHQSQLQAILPKKGSHFGKKNEKIMNIYVLDIPKYSFIILYSKTNVSDLERHPDIYPFRSIS